MISQRFKVACVVNFGDSAFPLPLLVDNLTYAKYILPERSFSKEYINHHKSGPRAEWKIFSISSKFVKICRYPKFMFEATKFG